MRGIKTKESGKWKKILIFVALLILLLALLNSVSKVYQKKKQAEKALVRMQEEVFDLKEKEKNLEGSIERMQTSEGLGFEIRKKLNVAEVGESVAIIVGEEISSTTASTTSSAWQKIKSFFSNIFK